MTIQMLWHGTDTELTELKRAVAGNCACRWDDLGVTELCGPHHMLEEDQRALNGLVFARRNVKRLLVEEFCLESPTC